MIVAGTVTLKMAERVKRPTTRCRAQVRDLDGSCANSGGPYWHHGYSVLKGVERRPVDVYTPGCPPRPEAPQEAIMKPQEKIRSKTIGKPVPLIAVPSKVVRSGPLPHGPRLRTVVVSIMSDARPNPVPPTRASWDASPGPCSPRTTLTVGVPGAAQGPGTGAQTIGRMKCGGPGPRGMGRLQVHDAKPGATSLEDDDRRAWPTRRPRGDSRARRISWGTRASRSSRSRHGVEKAPYYTMDLVEGPRRQARRNENLSLEDRRNC